MKSLIAFIALLISSMSAVSADIVIYGGTPGGISAARMGREVTLVEYHGHLGGMTTRGSARATSKTAR